ncbi:MAG: hypothetical protein AB2761_03455 [Candidatus Thiodiazotropha endolucinida]
MTERRQDPDLDMKKVGVNPGYAAFQISKALTTSKESDDAATRERTKKRISKWETVLRNILTGSVEYGSRKPVEGVPEWATLEVVTGGFATGELLASGPLQEHEQKLLENIPAVPDGEERRALNAYFLTDAGLAELQNLIDTGCYDVGVPEEAALLVVAWLVQKGYTDDARRLLDKLSPYFSRLRFYMIPLQLPQRFGSRVHLQDVRKTIEDLHYIKPNNRIRAQKEAIEVWAPLYDRIVSMFLETVKDDWPCQDYPEGWSERALAILCEYTELRNQHTLCGKMERTNGHSAQLREFLGRCARKPDTLTGQEVGRIRLILKRYVEKRGEPTSTTCVEARRRQAAHVNAPSFHAISRIVVSRLEKHPKDDGLDDLSPLNACTTEEEAAKFSVPEGTLIPSSIQRKVERCLNETVDVLVERDLITSGDTLARVLPQMTSEIRAVGINDPILRQLYSATYRAFRRRRSLLLMNLEKQVQIEELPWIAALERFRSDSLSSQDIAKQTLEEITVLTLATFPHAIFPNKLLQEISVLAKSAHLDIPIVDELAADIFMGEFSRKFIESARKAADLLDESFYARYYGINYGEIRRITMAKEKTKGRWFQKRTSQVSNEFAQLCASRAGVLIGTWDPASNGMIIEQQQILTTQNLAALFDGLELTNAIRDRLDGMTKQCFKWICRRQQMKIGTWHAQLIMLKNTAYAWRQMVFFLALLPDNSVTNFLRWAEEYLSKQTEEFRNRFGPAFNGLVLVANGETIDDDSTMQFDARRFLGWSKEKHWLLPDAHKP